MQYRYELEPWKDGIDGKQQRENNVPNQKGW